MQAAPGRRPEPGPAVLHQRHPLDEEPTQVGQGRAGTQLDQQVALVLHATAQHQPPPFAGGGHHRQLVVGVRDHPSRRIRRGGRPDVGDQVEQGVVLLVADRGHDRGAAGGHRPKEGLVAEGQQVLRRPAAAGDDDDVDVVEPVEVGDRVAHLLHGGGALDRDLAHLDPDRGPAAAGVLHHVVLGGAAPPADQAHRAGQERQRSLAVGGEQAFPGQGPLELLDPRQQLAFAQWTHHLHPQREGSALGVEARLDPHDHAGALTHGRAGGVQGGHGAGGRHRHLDVGVAQVEEDQAGAGPPLEGDDLSLHPQGRHAGHVHADVVGEQAQRPGRVGRGVAGAVGHRPGGRGGRGSGWHRRQPTMRG